MANAGKYVDRNPCTRTAGFVFKANNSAGDCLKMHNLNEYLVDIMQKRCQHDMWWSTYEQVGSLPNIPKDNVTALLTPELAKSRFISFREKFAEDMYFKRADIGASMAPLSKPDEINNETTTFGAKPRPTEPLYDVVLPNKPLSQVNRDYLNFHRGYVVSHKHYLPSEQVNRSYNEAFDPQRCYGKNTNVDTEGIQVKKCLEDCEKLLVISKQQRYFLERAMYRVGKHVYRYDNDIPFDMAHGVASKPDVYNAAALIENLDPVPERQMLLKSLVHLDRVRRRIFNRREFHFHDVLVACQRRDRECTGFLTLQDLFELCKQLLIEIDKEMFAIVLRHFKLLVDDGLPTERVDYNEFMKLLQIQRDLPPIGNTSIMPKEFLTKDTTYRDFCKFTENTFHSSLQGPPKLPLEKYEPDDDLESVDFKLIRQWPMKVEPTNIGDIITPDIPTQFGLVPSDFERPRTKQLMRQIFQNAIKSDEDFDTAWNMALEKYEPADGLLTINELRDVRNKEEEKEDDFSAGIRFNF